MIDKLIAAALTRPAMARKVLREELERLREGGYLPEGELEALTEETLARLEAQLERARATVQPVVTGLTASVREALDLPSRSEILALTEELRRHRGEPERDGP